MAQHKESLAERQAAMKQRPRAKRKLHLSAEEIAKRSARLKAYHAHRLMTSIEPEDTMQVDRMLEMADSCVSIRFSESTCGAIMQSSLGGRSFGLVGSLYQSQHYE